MCVVISVVGLLVCECPCILSYLQCVILFVSITLILAVLHDDMLLSLQNKKTALIMAVERGHLECVIVLLNGGAEVNVQSKVSVVSDDLL